VATYEELFALCSDTALKNRVRVACVVAAESIRQEDPGTVERRAWATGVFGNPGQEADRMFWTVLAANKDLPAATIQGASDAAIQSNVDAAVDLFATG